MYCKPDPKFGQLPVFTLPESFIPEEHLPEHLHKFADDARYLLDLVLTKTVHHNVNDRGQVVLASARLRMVMRSKFYSEVIDCLDESGVINRCLLYIPDVESRGYKLAERFAGDRHVRVNATSPRFIRAYLREQARRGASPQNRMLPVDHTLRSLLPRLQIDGDAARRVLDDLSKTSRCNENECQGILVSDIEDGNYRHHVGRCGRRTNNVTNLKRELRRNLHVDGEQLGAVDISCCQPALLGKMVLEARNGGDIIINAAHFRAGDDVHEFVQLAKAGTLYDDLAADVGLGRDAVKKRFIADVLAKEGSYHSSVESRFGKKYPTIHSYIQEVNRSNHGNLIRGLQRKEASLVVESVCADFVDENPGTFAVPLFDAVYVAKRDVGKLEDAFHRGFRRIGYEMKLKTEF